MSGKLGKILLILIISIVAVLLIGFLVLFVTEYCPDDVEKLKSEGESIYKLEKGTTLNIVTYNIGYLSLDSSQDFFMDGGQGIMPETNANVQNNLYGVKRYIKEKNADIYLLQEVDYKAKRSYKVNQYEELKAGLGYVATYSTYHKCLFIPYPLTNPVGYVHSGMMILNKYAGETERIAFDSAYKFPMSMVMFKRCLMVQRINIEDTDNELVIINLHLEAYDNGNSREKQLKKLKDIMTEEYEKGNYVIAGGDFNHTFPVVDKSKYPVLDDRHFSAKEIPEDYLPEGFKYAVDDETPTSRLLDKSYKVEDKNTQLYVIDGYILSPNVKLNSVKTVSNDFKYSDHHPVELNITIE